MLLQKLMNWKVEAAAAAASTNTHHSLLILLGLIIFIHQKKKNWKNRENKTSLNCCIISLTFYRLLISCTSLRNHQQMTDWLQVAFYKRFYELWLNKIHITFTRDISFFSSLNWIKFHFNTHSIHISNIKRK